MCALIKVGERGKFTFKDKRKKTKIIKPMELVKDRQSEIVYQYSKMGFNFHSVLRLKPEQKDFKGFVLDEHTTKAYNNKSTSPCKFKKPKIFLFGIIKAIKIA